MAFGMTEDMRNACCEYFLESYSFACHTLVVLFKAVESAFGLIAGMGLNIYKHLAYWKRIAFDVNKKVDLAEFGASPVLRYAPEVCCGY
jgi:hypothetical protein